MKHMTWAIVVVGLVVAGCALPAEAAGGRGGGVQRGGSGWNTGSPRMGTGSHVGSPRMGTGWHAGSPRMGTGSHVGSPQWGGGFHSGGGGWYGGTRVFIGGGLGWWGWPGWWGPSYPYYGYYAAPPVVVQPAPMEYIQAPAPPAQDYWYYCQSAGMYYPYVKECPGGWTQVVPQPAPPDR